MSEKPQSCPDLTELPPPPPERRGWPWTVAAPRTPPRRPDGGAWPRVSVVMPSLNQGEYIEEAIRSVLLQGYPDLEFLVIDGASTDQSVAIIRKYEQWIRWWISEPDRGQAHALNKGLEHATGSLFRWLNSDDLLVEGSLAAAACAHCSASGHIIAGDVIRFSGERAGGVVYSQNGFRWPQFAERWWAAQWASDGLVFPMEIVRQAGAFDEQLHSIFDYEFACRCLALAPALELKQPVAMFRDHPRSKTAIHPLRSLREHGWLAQRRRSAYPELDFRSESRLLAARLLAAGLSRLRRGHADGFACLREAASFGPRALVAGSLWRLASRLACWFRFTD